MKISISSVRPGMVVDEAIYDPKTNALLLQYGAEITPRILISLRFHCIPHVSITVPYTLYQSPSESMASFLLTFFQSKIKEIAPEHEEGNLNNDMIYNAKRVIGLLKQVTKDTNVMDLCVELKLANNRELFLPSLYSTVRAALVAGAMHLSDDTIYDIVTASLLQNVGLIEMNHLLSYANLTAEQQELYNEHCQYGYYVLKEKGISTAVAQLVLCHHEQYDGQGFPNGLKGDEIPIGSKIISLCSDFDLMYFKQAKQIHEIADILYAEGDVKYDSRVIDAFILNIPLYTIGSIVRLSNREVGVVVNIRTNMGPYPIVRVCYNNCNKPYTDSFIIDLAAEKNLYIIEVLS